MFLTAVICSGCSALKPVDANAWAKNYYDQQRMGDVVAIKGKGMSITMTNVDEIKVANLLPTVSIIPREPSVLDNMTSMLPYVGMAYMGVQALKTKPTVVNQPEPMVIRPEIVRP